MKCLAKNRLAYINIRVYDQGKGNDVLFRIECQSRSRADLVAAFVFTMEFDQKFADAVKSAIIEYNERKKFEQPPP